MTLTNPYNRKIDILTEDDYAIFEKAASNANYFTDWYCRTPTSGTTWSKFTDDPEKKAIWEHLFTEWMIKGQPKEFDYLNMHYKVNLDAQKVPSFFVNHGWLWQDWQLEAHHCSQEELTIIGGFGSGKTAYIAMALFTLACTIPNFRGYSVAPQMLQAMEVYKYIKTTCSNTQAWNRWVWRSPERPNPRFVIKNDFVGESTIDIFSIEKDPEKVRTLEGDIIFLDQAEKIQNLEDLTRDLGSRLRGTIMGRPRMGKLAYIANAGDNDALWYRYSLAEEQPKIYKSMSPKSTDNPFLSKSDIERLKRTVGGTPEEIAQWMDGQRPPGKGEHFTKEVVMACVDQSLNQMMDQMLESAAAYHAGVYGGPAPEAVEFVKRETSKAGIYHWEMPPDRTREYCVIADLGQGDPPYRNAPCIMVWDITDFPAQPAVMRAFHWIYAHGSYMNFVNEYERMVKLYRAQARNAFDSTGVSKGFDELVFMTMNLSAEGMNMAGNGKYLALNAAKLLLQKHLMRFPYIPHMVNQLTNYKLPDEKIPQDIVMTLAMSAAFIRRYYYEDVTTEEEATFISGSTQSRYARPGVFRYGRN